MIPFAWTVALAALLGGLLAGFLFAFAVVVMPGISSLDDREFLQAFQAIDRVIQNGQPLFISVWVGSTLALLIAAGQAVVSQSGLERATVIAAALANVLLVQAPTMRVNIPLNNAVQALECGSLSDAEANQAREAFEPRWNRWNRVRTVVSCAILAGLVVVLARL